MTVLSDRDIRKHLKQGEIVLLTRDVHGNRAPIRPEQIQPNSVDVYLSNVFVRYPWEGDSEPEEYESLELEPYERLLGSTIEWIELPDFITARIEGVSSQARRGIINQLAPVIPAGFRGEITLEIQNTNMIPIRLCAGEKIGQILFSYLSSPAERPYGHPELGSRYQAQEGATPMRHGPTDHAPQSQSTFAPRKTTK